MSFALAGQGAACSRSAASGKRRDGFRIAFGSVRAYTL